MEKVTTRGDFPHVHPVCKRFHADDALWSIKLIDFLGLSILDIGYQLAVSVNQRVMHDSAHGFPVLAPVLPIRVLALPSPHFRHRPVPLRRFRVDLSPIGFDHVVDTLPIHSLVAILAAQAQHHGATGHAKAAEQNHHE